MKEHKKKMFMIKMAYWLGIGADAIWAAGLLIPSVYGMMSGNPDFAPDFQTLQIMRIGGALMTGWTILLVWAVRKPIERRFVILLTANVAFGMFIVAFKGLLSGNTIIIWALIKCSILIAAMINSYILAGKVEKEMNRSIRQ